MIIGKHTITEYHENGNIRYIETWSEIQPATRTKYFGVIVRQDRTHLIRTGLCAKFFDTGLLEWGLLYGEDGEVIRKYRQKRADGKFKTYVDWRHVAPEHGEIEQLISYGLKYLKSAPQISLTDG